MNYQKHMPFFRSPAFAAGISAAILFILLHMVGFSSLFLLLSIIPLLYTGFTQPFTMVTRAVATASIVLLLFSPLSSVYFVAIIAVPALFIGARQQRQHPLILAVTDICLYALVSLSLIHLATLDSGGIPGWIIETYRFDSMEQMDPALMQHMEWLSSTGSYLLIGMLVWWAVIFILIASWLTEKLLKNGQNDAKKIAIRYFSTSAMPGWLLLALIFSILIGFLAPETLRFLGLLSFVIILLPYFFSGAMYTPLRNTLEKSLGWSLVITMILLVLAWPAILITALGVFKHTDALINK